MSNFDEEPTFEDETPVEEEEEGSNRTFLISAGVLGGLVLLGLLCAAGYLFFSRNSTQQAEATAFAQATSQQATIQAGLTQTGIAKSAAEALTQTAAPTNTLPPTNTPVIAEATFTPAGSSATLKPAAAATIAAGLTQFASSQNNSASTVAAANTQLANSTQDPAAAATIVAGLTQIATAQNSAASTAAAGLTQLASAPNPATATIAAGFTQLAMSTQTVIATTTALPTTGIGDEIGAPGLLLMAIALVVVIFLVRRLRSSSSQ